jgi:hypothetical protein
MTKASNVILVHGAWADGSSWSKVIPLLLDGGLRATAAQLPLTALKDDVVTVKRAIALEAHRSRREERLCPGPDPYRKEHPVCGASANGCGRFCRKRFGGVVESQTKLVSRCNGGPRHPAKPGKSDGQGHLRQDGRDRIKPCCDAGAPERDGESDLGSGGPCLAI